VITIAVILLLAVNVWIVYIKAGLRTPTREEREKNMYDDKERRWENLSSERNRKDGKMDAGRVTQRT